MTAGPAPGPVLAVDISASGGFIPIGRIAAPGAGLAAAMRELQDASSSPELLELAVHYLASNVFGFCAVESAAAVEALLTCLAAQLAAEWWIEIPGEGILRALFTVARFEPVPEGGGIFALGLRLAGKPAFQPSKSLKV